MKPGSWLEIPDYDSIKAAQIFSLGQVNTFVVKELAGANAPEYPFLILIEDIFEIKNSNWKLEPQFQGFLLRTENIQPDEYNVLEKLWVDFVINDLKKADASLSKLKEFDTSKFFISASDKISPRKIYKLLAEHKIEIQPRPHDLPDSQYVNWAELENFHPAELVQNAQASPELSIIIPHFESSYFLCNVLKHLEKAVAGSPLFEVLIIDDGSRPKTFEDICYFALRHLPSLSIKIFRWKNNNTFLRGEKIFRAGASRNWGAACAKSENLFFMDADMLAPPQIVTVVLDALANADVVQFVRKHIPQHLSNETISYQDIENSEALYVEESKYWNILFDSEQWSSLADYWKYTCTYALAVRKQTFENCGRIRRNFIRYGFEDTDLGYRLFKANKKFELNKLPLFHLTAKPDHSQGFLFKLKKIQRISPMAKTFYKLNLDPQIFQKFQSLLD